ncbi:MAG: ABC transporter ATP-binding protein [Acidimicrobiia bacterium]
MNLADPAIKVEGLVKRYKSTTALAGLDCVVPSGAITGLLGPNGAGKTTLFRSLLGLTRTDAGSILVLGQEIPRGLVQVTKKIGAIIEEPGLIRALTGRVNLQVAADQLGFGHSRLDDLLDFVSLQGDAGRKVDEYSKGMRQRLALAAALIGDPQLLLLDEPLDGLDPAGQMAFRARLREIADSGQTVVVSSHDLADIEALADYVVVLNHGKLVTEGPLEDMLSGGATRVVTDDTDTAMAALSTAGIDVRQDRGALVVEEDDGSRVVRVLAEAGIYPKEVSPARSTLESVFLGMTGEDEQ